MPVLRRGGSVRVRVRVRAASAARACAHTCRRPAPRRLARGMRQDRQRTRSPRAPAAPGTFSDDAGRSGLRAAADAPADARRREEVKDPLSPEERAAIVARARPTRALTVLD